jgi:hypothetical protein
MTRLSRADRREAVRREVENGCTEVAARDCGGSPFGTLVNMERLLFFIGMNIGGAIGWWLGDCLGYALVGEFLFSAAGSIAGIVIVWRMITSDRD